MKKTDNAIKSALDKEIGRYLSFDSVWNKHNEKKTIKWYMKKNILIPLIILMTAGIFSTGFVAAGLANRKIDNINYPFVNDPAVIGQWKAVDFVPYIEDFKPGYQSWGMRLFLQSLTFESEGAVTATSDNGKSSGPYLVWTKDLVLDKYDQIASKYVIKEIDGHTFMFFEWKNGDYVFHSMTPYYYVLVKEDGNNYTFQTQPRTEDFIDYPFVDNPELKGVWKTVDYVTEINAFDPENEHDGVYGFLRKMTFGDNGQYSYTTASGDYSEGQSWTGDLVIDSFNRMASKCTIKEINGTAYLFFEWKTGDYTRTGEAPGYYVLKRAD